MSEEHESVTGSREHPIRVLIVDDHDVLASSLAMVLDAEGDIRTAGVATTLEQARTLLGTARPDVVLLDHRMPDGDGVAAIPGCAPSDRRSGSWCSPRVPPTTC